MAESKLAIGLMSGTSRDGIDAALIETDGLEHVRPLAFLETPYEEDVRDRLAEACSAALTLPRPMPYDPVDWSSDEITTLHIEAVKRLLDRAGRSASEIAAIGFHGHAVAHRPELGWTWQIGDAERLARETGIAVVSDLRSADVAAGGQGAPLLPVYHRALAAELEKPVAVLNLGGVANITFIGAGEDELIAFDTGMASAMIDDWVRQTAGLPFDKNGALAASGKVDDAVLAGLLDHPYFTLSPPKSLERAAFPLAPLQSLAPADGAATLTAFSAEGVRLGLELLPARPGRIYVAGGGRHNATLMRTIAERTGLELVPVDDLGWNGDAVEAQGFAYIAVRTLEGLPFSFPGTTGVPEPLTGGTLTRP